MSCVVRQRYQCVQIWNRQAPALLVYKGISGNTILLAHGITVGLGAIIKCPSNNVIGPNSSELKALAPNQFLFDENSASFPLLTLDESFDHRKRYVRAQA